MSNAYVSIAAHFALQRNLISVAIQICTVSCGCRFCRLLRYVEHPEKATEAPHAPHQFNQFWNDLDFSRYQTYTW